MPMKVSSNDFISGSLLKVETVFVTPVQWRNIQLNPYVEKEEQTVDTLSKTKRTYGSDKYANQYKKQWMNECATPIGSTKCAYLVQV